MSSLIFLHCLVFIFSVSSALGVSEGMFEKIKIGLQNAKNYLERARDIADLVSESLRIKQFEKKRGDDVNFTNKQGKKPFELTNLVSTFFRLLGLDFKKVTAFTVNSFVFFVQMISELFKLTPKVEHFKAVDEHKHPLNPILLIKESENEKIQYLLKQAQDKDLPKQLIEQAHGGDFSCIRLLLCKASPIIWAAQKSLSNGSINCQHNIISWLPSKDKFEEHSDACDDKHRDCPLNFAPQ